VAREALKHLRAANGRIVNIGSLGGMHAWADHAHYCGSKAALHMLTQAMAKAFAPEVSVNCVAPGWIEFPEDEKCAGARFAARTPMRRNGTADDVAQRCCCLPLAAFCDGADSGGGWRSGLV